MAAPLTSLRCRHRQDAALQLQHPQRFPSAPLVRELIRVYDPNLNLIMSNIDHGILRAMRHDCGYVVCSLPSGRRSVPLFQRDGPVRHVRPCWPPRHTLLAPVALDRGDDVERCNMDGAGRFHMAAYLMDRLQGRLGWRPLSFRTCSRLPAGKHCRRHSAAFSTKDRWVTTAWLRRWPSESPAWHDRPGRGRACNAVQAGTD